MSFSTLLNVRFTYFIQLAVPLWACYVDIPVLSITTNIVELNSLSTGSVNSLYLVEVAKRSLCRITMKIRYMNRRKFYQLIQIWRTLGVAMLLCEEVQFGWRFSVLQGFEGAEVLRVFAPPFPLSPCRYAVNVGQPTDLFWKYAPPLASKKRM